MAAYFILIIYLAFISLGLPDSLLGTAWPAMQPELGAPLDTAGWLFMCITAGTIVSSLASGSVVARFGTGRTTLVSCLMTACALLGFAYAPSVWWLVACAVPLGLGGGAVDAGLNHYVAAHYQAHHMNWLHCFWGVGATLGPVLMAQQIAGEGSWRGGYLTVAGLQFAMALVLLLSLPWWKKAAGGGGSGETAAAQEEVPQPEKPWKAKGLGLALAAFLLYCGVETTVGLWGSSFLVDAKGASASAAAQGVSLYYAGITVGRFVTGFVSFKASNRTLIRAGQCTALAGAALLCLPLPFGASVFGLLVIGLGLAPIYPSMLHETPARFGERHASAIMGYQMAVAYTGSTLIPPLLGFLATRTSLGILPMFLFVSAAAMLLASEQLEKLLRKAGKKGEGTIA